MIDKLSFAKYQQLIQNQCDSLTVAVPTESELKFGYENHRAILQAIDAAGEKKISFSDFVNLALYHPTSGYYTSGKTVLGADGDFITAPEISDVFSLAVARSIAPAVTEVGGHIIEFGAGSGAMAATLLKFFGAEIQSYTIVEISPSLRARQEETLRQQQLNYQSVVNWITELPEQPVDAVVLGNELLDAIPAHRFQWRPEGFFEEFIVARESTFQSTWQAVSSGALLQWLALHQDKVDWHEGCVYEASPWRNGWVNSVAALLNRGMVLLLDYGYHADDFFSGERTKGTVNCFYRHHSHSEYRYLTGLQDVTSHVNFSELCFAAESAGLTLEAYATQTDLILQSGVLQQLETIDDTAKRLKLSQALQQLMMPGQMGSLIKAIAFSRNIGQNAASNIPKQLNSRL